MALDCLRSRPIGTLVIGLSRRPLYIIMPIQVILVRFSSSFSSLMHRRDVISVSGAATKPLLLITRSVDVLGYFTATLVHCMACFVCVLPQVLPALNYCSCLSLSVDASTR